MSCSLRDDKHAGAERSQLCGCWRNVWRVEPVLAGWFLCSSVTVHASYLVLYGAMIIVLHSVKSLTFGETLEVKAIRIY